ncbi:kinase-like domain-containing protein [Aspergillus transmontanensis]|uniref:Kinase-like domain-containing protein n=1 Tax=Aspergillus transmontanensis TaxID=1034304 RepID=A0A5N6WF83_9EURO|nr:kinase-like domain-containing protein [Aspergillus transmontanensis]
MASSLRLGQCLRGRNGIYAIGKQLQETNQPVIVKSVPHFRLQNERDPSDPPVIVLKYLDDNLLNASISKRLTDQEIRYVARRILEALRFYMTIILYTQFEDIKPDNILVSYGQGDIRLTDVQPADCGNTVPADSASPEVQLRIGWGTQTDIWSFGALLVALLYGDNFFLFKPDVPADHDEYESKILQRQCQFFGPFPLTYREICPQETLNILAYIMKRIPPEKKKPFSRISEQEISKDRPSAAELLQDEWFFGKGK